MSVLQESKTFGDVLRGHAQQRPEKIAFETLDGKSISFADFNRRVNRLNNSILEKGIAKGARVAILSKNRPEYVEIYGLSKSGIVVVPLNWRLAVEELKKLITHSEPEVLFVDELHFGMIDVLRSEFQSVKHFVVLGDARPGWISYEKLLALSDDSESTIDVGSADVLCLIYTSGTTGAPKGVAITHSGALGNASTAAGEMLSLSETDHTMAVMPLFHAGGMWYHLFPSFATGCTTLLLSEFEPGTVLLELQRRRISNVHLVPTMIGAILAHPHVGTSDLSCVRLLFYAASSMPPELLRRAMEAFPRCGFAQAYGSTEGGILTILNPRDHEKARSSSGEHLLLSCGKPISSHQIRVIDDIGASLPQGSVGEIEVCSSDVMKGYWNNVAATDLVMSNGWLKTGDLGYFDTEGYLYIVDRKNDMIVTGGENVFPTEVEVALFSDADVLEAAVFGVPDPIWVEKVVAAVVLKQGTRPTSEELLQRMRSKLAPYKCPKTIYFVSSLPKSAVGKVLRKELRKQYGSSD